MALPTSVQFYRNVDALADIVAAFLADGLQHGDPALLIASPERRALIEARLRDQRIEISSVKRLGDLVALDAQEMLDLVMLDGIPNADAFHEAMNRTIEQIYRGREGRQIRAFADVIDLVGRGDITPSAAIRLETLWNEFAVMRRDSLLCSYAVGNFYKGHLTQQPNAMPPSKAGSLRPRRAALVRPTDS